MKWENRDRYFPPGYEYDREITVLLLWFVTSILTSFRFLAEYFDARDNLFVWRAEGGIAVEKVIRQGAKIRPFAEL